MAAKNRAFVSKAPALSVRACVYEREWWLLISEFSKKEKGEKKNPRQSKTGGANKCLCSANVR